MNVKSEQENATGVTQPERRIVVGTIIVILALYMIIIFAQVC